MESLAAIVGAEQEVRAGLQSVGFGDITLGAVRLGVDRAANTLAFILMRGSLSLAGKVVNLYVRLPDFEFGGALSPRRRSVSRPCWSTSSGCRRRPARGGHGGYPGTGS